MTREELEGIRKLDYEIHRLKTRLYELLRRSPVASPVSSASRGSGIADKTAELAQRKIDLEQEIAEKSKRLQALKGFINSISDDVIREIVYCKCVQGFRFGEISKITGLPAEAAKNGTGKE